MPPPNPYASLAVDGIAATLTVARARSPLPAVDVVVLTAAEADFLRRAGFPTAMAGQWTLSPLPPAWLMSRYPALAVLTGQRDVSAAPHDVPPAPAPAPLLARSYRRPAVSPWHWLSSAITRDQRRILTSIVARGTPDLAKRALQQRLHRLCAMRFNDAVDQLVARGVLRRAGTRLQVVAPLDALRALGIGVSPPAGARARAGQPRTAQSPGRAAGRTAGTPKTVHGSRVLPPAGTSAWGRSMLARRGGLAVQRKYRLDGRHPTAAATRARLARHHRRRP
jgi:hypothetical protein